MFQNIVPPILPLHLGSLGFLTPFTFQACTQALRDMFEGEGYRSTVRMRLRCTVYRYRPELSRHKTRQSSCGDLYRKSSKEGAQAWERLETAWMRKHLKQEAQRIPQEERIELMRQIPCYTTSPEESFEVLNELVVDRGPSSYMSMLELFGDEQHLTTVQADGLCIATPTGSTAYTVLTYSILAPLCAQFI